MLVVVGLFKVMVKGECVELLVEDFMLDSFDVLVVCE